MMNKATVMPNSAIRLTIRYEVEMMLKVMQISGKGNTHRAVHPRDFNDRHITLPAQQEYFGIGATA